MTMQKLCDLCSTLSTEFNTAARKMDTGEFAEFRKRLAVKYNVGFDNGWTLRVSRRVSDTFTVEQLQVWTQTKKGLFGKRSGSRIIMTLRSSAVPELAIRCTSADTALAGCLQTGASVKVTGELEAAAFLRAENVEWKEGAFGKNVRVSAV